LKEHSTLSHSIKWLFSLGEKSTMNFDRVFLLKEISGYSSKACNTMFTIGEVLFMQELVGECKECKKQIFCNDGFINGVVLDDNT
jgi:hypothetical protein